MDMRRNCREDDLGNLYCYTARYYNPQLHRFVSPEGCQ